MTRKFLSTFLVLVLVLPAFSALGYETLIVPTEVRHIDRSRVYDGYTLFAAIGRTYLIDLDGRLVHTWNTGQNPKLLDNGHILDMGRSQSGFPRFIELDWDSSVVWEYLEKRPDYSPHHDFNRIFNRQLNQYTTIYIANKNVTHEQAIAAGCDPANGPYNGSEMDAIIEVDMNGTVVWEWWFFDHAIQDIAPAKDNYVGAGKSISDYPGKMDLNLPGRPVRGDWLHCNALDYNPGLDQIVISSVQGEFYVIDHGGTFIPGDPNGSIALAADSAGDFLYRFGDPARYGRGDPPSILEDWTKSTSGNKQLGGVHDVQWIDEGLPGAGHFLVFNNGQYMMERKSQSYVLEINGYLDSDGKDTGQYVDPPDAGYNLQKARDPVNTSKQDRLVSKQVVWSYSSKSSQAVFSHIGSSAQRLPNGNLLICSDSNGRLFEVTREGDVVWEYVNPVTGMGRNKVMGDNWPMASSVFRAYRYGPGHPAFAGRNLPAGDPLAGRLEGPEFRPEGGATETFYLDNESSFGGYTLYAAGGTTYLIDMEGKVVNTWGIGTSPRLLDNGTLLDATSSDPASLGGIEMLDWDGAVLWKYSDSRPGYIMHHDFLLSRDKEMNEDTLMYLASRPVTAEEALGAGCDPDDGPYDDARTDGVVEVDLEGTVIWEWWFIDHGIQDIDPGVANYVGDGNNISDTPGRIDLNLPGRPVSKDWLDCNSIDYSRNLDQVVVNSGLGEFYVIDHGATFVAGDPQASLDLARGPAGDFIYRFGDPARYGQGAPPSVNEDWTSSTTGNKQLGGSSNVHWIGAGLPGEGRFLVFNNGQYLFERTSQSYIFEVAPFHNSTASDTGDYVDPPGAGYYTLHMPKDTHKEKKLISNQVVWVYYSKNNEGFFSHLGSSAQRLPNGNTFVCAMTEGHLFEVTRDGTPVWEYINPVTVNGIADRVYDNYPMTNPVYRALRYGANHPALRGKDLSANSTITGAPVHYMTPDVLNNAGGSPKITGTAQSPVQPTPSDIVFITTTVPWRPDLVSVMLTYSTTVSGRASGESTAFRETMAVAPSKPWDGTGADNPWTVTAAAQSLVEQRTAANFGEGNPCGLEFGTGTTDLNDTMVETAQAIDASGSAGYVEFHLWANGLEGTDGWTFQLDSGSGYETRLGELGGINHDWQDYRYELQEGELVGALKMRFQFRAGDKGDRLRLDQICLNVSSDGGTHDQKVTRPMLDDGMNGDGLPGDNIFGAAIPPFPEPTRVDYYITALVSGGLKATDPPGAPAKNHSYTVAEIQEPLSTGRLPDTGQTGDYTDTFGEDSDYTVHAPAFTDNGDGTVTDGNTGLVWQKADGGEMTREFARAYAANLSLGGHNDWRLPTSSELFNLLDHGRADFALDTAFFPKSSAHYYWSSDTLAGDAGRIWAVDTGGGIGAHANNETISAGGGSRFDVRCVRGRVAGLQGGSFTANGDGTVTSAVTGLVWQQSETVASRTWEEALAYCEGLVLGGHDDWRLPNVKELRSLSNDTLSMPSVDLAAFPGARASGYWTSTTGANAPARAWFVDFSSGQAGHDDKTRGLFVRAVRGGANVTRGSAPLPELVSVPGGTFGMGDHRDTGVAGPGRPADELPVHNVTVEGFQMGMYEVTNAQYCLFLGSDMARGFLTVSGDGVFSRDGSTRYCDLSSPSTSSRISWDGRRFSVLDGRMTHPVTGVRWEGAAAYCNWLGAQTGHVALYDPGTGEWNATAAGYRLPTEAEWECAALGGRYDPYPVFPWGDAADADRANGPESSDPYEAGALPFTTPVGFYDGSLRQRADFGWPGGQAAYQAGNGSNLYGLYDLSGNAWEWVNDLYNASYYSFSPYINPPGPANATLMQDGKAYHALRGGSWFWDAPGQTRLADRGPLGPDSPFYNVGFRVVLVEARQTGSVVSPGSGPVKLADGFLSADGPAADAAGNLYFTDAAAGQIYTWSLDGKLSVFQNFSGRASDLFFDSDGSLIASEGGSRRVASIDVSKSAAPASVLATAFNDKPFNSPFYLWVDPRGGIYFSDPLDRNGTLSQEGQNIYYLAPGAPVPVLVMGDLAWPGGLVGKADGRMLYISDRGAGVTYRCTVLGDGSLSEKELFLPLGSAGMTMDADGNVYLTERSVLVFDAAGNRIDEIAVPERPTNLEFGGSDRHTLFITTESGLYSVRMAAGGVSNFRPEVFINEVKREVESSPDNGTGKMVSWVELFNKGTGPADLGGMYLTNGLSSPRDWMIPANTTIAPGGFLVIWADGGRVPGPLRAPFELDAAGGVVALFMPNGLTQVDSLRFGPLPDNASWGRYPDGTHNLVLMHDHPSPGAPNVQDDTPGGAGGGSDEPAGGTPGGEDPVAGTPDEGLPTAVTLDRPAGPNLVLAVIAAAVAAAAGLYVYDRRVDRKGPGTGSGKQQH